MPFLLGTVFVSSDFSTPRYNSVTHGRQSLRYLGPKLWGNYLRTIDQPQHFNEVKRRLPGKDMNTIIEAGCKGCVIYAQHDILKS